MAIPLVKGTPVISLTDGATLGTIDHVYFDPQRKAVVGFTFHQGGGLLGRGTSGLVEITDVHAFGPDAVTITDVSAVRSELAMETHKEALLELEHLLKRRVMTEGGMQIGRVGAIQFSDASYRLSGLEVIVADAAEPVHIGVDQIQTIGEELIIIAEGVPLATEERGSSRQALRVVASLSPESPASPPHRRDVRGA